MSLNVNEFNGFNIFNLKQNKNKLADIFETCNVIFEKNALKNDDIVIDLDSGDYNGNINGGKNNLKEYQIRDCQIRDSGFGLNYKSYLFGESYHFGLLNLKVKKIEINDALNASKKYTNKKSVYIVFSVDNSGSMSDMCNDNKTKMDYIIHTLKNIMCYFVDNGIDNIIVSIYTFDSDISRILYRTHVNKDNIDRIIDEINNIEPRGSTNIEYALQNAYDEINDYKLANRNNKNGCGGYNEFEIYHIFMTDGDANEGSTNVMYLSKYINTCASNVFIGVGTAHNLDMLHELANVNDNGYYYIIDDSAKAGIVYGEILHGLLYKCVKDFEVTIENGYIYNWKTNKWCTSLYVGNLISDSSLTYYVISNKIGYGNGIDIGIGADCIKYDKVLNINLFGYIIKYDSIASFPVSDIQYNVYSCDDNYGYVMFEKHKYRQRVLDLLWNIKKYNNKNCFIISRGNNSCNSNGTDLKLNKHTYSKLKLHLKKNMKILFKEMRCFMKNNSLLYDSFMTNLCDDVYIAYKTFNSKYSNMFTLARQMSQGDQRACCGISNVNDTEIKFDIDFDSNLNANSTKRHRNISKSIDIYDVNMPEILINNNHSNSNNNNFDFGLDSDFDYCNNENENEDEDINKYVVSNDSFDNCKSGINSYYATAQCINIISNIRK